MTFVISALGGAKYDIHSTDGSNLLHLTAFTGDLKLTQMMADLGIDKHTRDIEGWLPVHYACYYGHTQVAKWWVMIFAVKFGNEPTVRFTFMIACVDLSV